MRRESLYCPNGHWLYSTWRLLWGVVSFFVVTFFFIYSRLYFGTDTHSIGKRSAAPEPCNLPSFNIISFLFPQSTAAVPLLLFLLPTASLYFIALLSPVLILPRSLPSLLRSLYSFFEFRSTPRSPPPPRPSPPLSPSFEYFLVHFDSTPRARVTTLKLLSFLWLSRRGIGFLESSYSLGSSLRIQPCELWGLKFR